MWRNEKEVKIQKRCSNNHKMMEREREKMDVSRKRKYELGEVQINKAD